MKARLLAGLLTAAGALLSLAALAVPLKAGTQDSLTVKIDLRDDWSPAPVTDLAATPGGEGQLLLQWTAPDGNNNLYPQQQTVAAYQIRVATFPASSVASTTAWWNAASAVTPPTPNVPGTLETKLLNGLEPGATVYAAIISFDAAGNVSPVDTRTAGGATQARAIVTDLAPPAPTGLTLVSVTSSTVQVSWSSSTASDLWYYKVYIDSTPPYDFSRSTNVAVASATFPTYTFQGLTVGTSYYVRVTAVDKGAPMYNGWPLESLPSASVSAFTTRPLTRPLAPYGISIATSATSATLGWMPTEAYETGVLFSNPASPTASELSGYHVYRATAPVAAPWTDLVTVSTSTLIYTDNAAMPGSYYMVKSYNGSGFSDASMVRGVGAKTAYVVAKDNATTFQLGDDVTTVSINGQGTPSRAYLVATSTHPELITGTVLSDVEFTAMRQGLTADRGVQLEKPGTLLLHYNYDAQTGQVLPGSLRSKAVNNVTPDQLSVFWNNGSKWVQLYGTLDQMNQRIIVQTPFFGEYQVRSVERPAGFAFNTQNLSNHMITPNGDGKNDDAVWTFSNPKASEVVGRIFDLRGRHVADMTPGTTPVGGSLVWDGKGGGRVVPGGVYVYQIESEGTKYTGTIIVIR